MFRDLRIREQCNRAGGRPRLGIYLRVGNRQRYLQQSIVEPLVPLLDAHFVAMRIAAWSPGFNQLSRS